MSDEQSQEECKCEAGAPKWVVTFGDMMSLLLTFFVLLLSFANMDVVKFKIVAGSLRDAFGVSTSVQVDAISAARDVISTQVQFQPNFTALMALRANAARQAKTSNKIEMESNADWVRLKIDGDALFAPGSATILEEAKPILDQVGDMIYKFSGTVVIEGHTDNNVPIGGTYLDNYALGFSRSNAILGYLVVEKSIDRKNLLPASYADTKPRETNNLPQGQARNRRVEFVFQGKLERELPGERLQPK